MTCTVYCLNNFLCSIFCLSLAYVVMYIYITGILMHGLLLCIMCTYWYIPWKLRSCLQKFMRVRGWIVYWEKKQNELHDDVSKCKDRIQKKYEMFQKRLADEEARCRQIMEEISGLEVKQKKLYDTEKLLDKVIVYWLFENRYSDIWYVYLYVTIVFIYWISFDVSYHNSFYSLRNWMTIASIYWILFHVFL